MYLLEEFNIPALVCLLLVWSISGMLILGRLFTIEEDELPLLGLGFGLVAATWGTNLAARFIPSTAGFWAFPLLLLLIGFLLWFSKKPLTNPFAHIPWMQLVFFAIFTIVFTLIGRGFGFFDDHQNLPPLSAMAAGDIPPHFAFNPSLMFGYHYFLLLTGSSFVRIANAGPWSALDLARGITLALTITYSGFLAKRLTGNRFIQYASMVFVLFAGGARWVLLLLPASLLRRISSSVVLIGSGADSGPNLATALLKNWNIEGQGPFQLPFMYGSGLDPSYSMFHNGWGTSAILLILLAILLARSVKQNWGNAVMFTILFSSLALANEVTFGFFYVGFVICALVVIIQTRSIKSTLTDRVFLWWFGVLVASGILALIQGGMLTEIFFGLFTPKTAAVSDTYFRVSFAFGLPAFLSAHLGNLSFINPYHWLPILGETGFVIFATPLIVSRLFEKLKQRDWVEASWLMSLFVSLAMVFFTYTGNAGPTAISRMQAHFLGVIKLMAIPLVWLWLKDKSDNWKLAGLGWGLVTIFSGLSLFGFQLTAMTQPTYAIFLSPLDATMFQHEWNKPVPGSMIFDPVYPRAATVFGRPIRSSKTMGETLPEWKALFASPELNKMAAAGYSYFYTDLKYQQKFASVILLDCVKLVDKVESADNGTLTDGRYLYDITACK